MLNVFPAESALYKHEEFDEINLKIKLYSLNICVLTAFVVERWLGWQEAGHCHASHCDGWVSARRWVLPAPASRWYPGFTNGLAGPRALCCLFRQKMKRNPRGLTIKQLISRLAQGSCSEVWCILRSPSFRCDITVPSSNVSC